MRCVITTRSRSAGQLDGLKASFAILLLSLRVKALEIKGQGLPGQKTAVACAYYGLRVRTMLPWRHKQSADRDSLGM